MRLCRPNSRTTPLRGAIPNPLAVQREKGAPCGAPFLWIPVFHLVRDVEQDVAD